MPRIERLKQNTPEWHRWRLQGIGASDAPVVMGDAPFKTRAYAVVDKDRTRPGKRRRSGGAARSRAGARARESPTSATSASRWSRCAWCTTNWNGCVHRSMGSASTVRSCSKSSAPGEIAIRPPLRAGRILRTTTRRSSTSWKSRGPRSCTTGRSMAAAGPWSGCTTTANTSRDCWRPKPRSGCGCWNSAGPRTGDELNRGNDRQWRIVALALSHRQGQARSRRRGRTEAARDTARTSPPRDGPSAAASRCLRSLRRGAIDYAANTGAAWRRSRALPQDAGRSRQDQPFPRS